MIGERERREGNSRNTETKAPKLEGAEGAPEQLAELQDFLPLRERFDKHLPVRAVTENPHVSRMCSHSQLQAQEHGPL